MADLQHIETLHSEGESPFLVKEDSTPETAATSEDPQYVECPVDSCGELLLLQELDYHLELHEQESGEPGEPDSPCQGETNVLDSEREPRPASSHSGISRARREAERQAASGHGHETKSRQAKAISAWRRLLKMPGSSSAQKLIPRRRHHDETKSSGASSTRGRRLGVGRASNHR